jgi:hypothetical protein
MEQFNHLVGKKLVDVNEVGALNGAHATKSAVEQLAAKHGFKTVRFCSESGFTDMEFREDRLKVTTDHQGVIKRVSLG